MKPATIILIEALIRQGKGALTALERWIDEVRREETLPIHTDQQPRQNARQ